MVSNDWLCNSIKHINCVNKWAFHELINASPILCPPIFHQPPPLLPTIYKWMCVYVIEIYIFLFQREGEGESFWLFIGWLGDFRIYRSANSNPTNDLNTNIQNAQLCNSFNSFKNVPKTHMQVIFMMPFELFGHSM